MRSPSTVTDAFTRPPTGRSLNVARPEASVVAVFGAPPTVSSTVWPGSALVSCPRITRTVTVPAGTSFTGSGMPEICFGSGICAP
jgi:hypothetical protein